MPVGYNFVAGVLPDDRLLVMAQLLVSRILAASCYRGLPWVTKPCIHGISANL